MGERFTNFITFVGGIFVIAVVVVVAGWIERLSQDARALGLGLIGGCFIGLVPVGVILGGVWIGVRWRETHARRETSTAAQPPMIVVQPPALPYYPSQPTLPVASDWQPTTTQRKFTVIGED